MSSLELDCFRIEPPQNNAQAQGSFDEGRRSEYLRFCCTVSEFRVYLEALSVVLTARRDFGADVY